MRLAAQRRLYELTRGRSREIEGVVRRVGWRGLVRGSKSRSPSKDRASRRILCLSIWKQRTISIIRHFVFIVPLARIKLSYVPFIITTFFFDVKDQKLRENFHWISVVLNSDGYSFKSSGSTTRPSTRWKFSYSLCTRSCGSDEYSCLYRYGYKHVLVPINKTSPFSSLFRNRYRNGCFFYVVYLSYWGVSGKTYVGHLLGVGCSFNLCINLVPYLHGCTAFSKASYRTGSYFNPCWTDRYTNNQVFSQLVEYIASTWEH